MRVSEDFVSLQLTRTMSVMKTLRQLLLEFDGSGMTEVQLQSEFREIAKAAIYGGHFRVNNEFDIHIIEVEFYYHSENDDISSVHDWAMYHRGKNVDYFPVGSLHPHNSGIDVTFEKEGEYRASFLIRQYEINGKIYSQPSYLREDLIGYTGCILGDGPKIEWKNVETMDSKDYLLDENPRINLGAYDEKGKRIKDQFDNRNWRFTRNP